MMLHFPPMTTSIATFNPSTFSLLIKKCIKHKSIGLCKQIHALMLTTLVDWHSFPLSSKLSAAYASCGDLNSAKLIFKKTKNPDIFVYNWMISAQTFHGHHDEAIGYFTWLKQSTRYFPNRYTFSCVLKACLGLMDVRKGMEVQSLICKMGFDRDVSVGNALIDMYSKCGKIRDARRVFDEMPERDVASWTSMIFGYVGLGRIGESEDLFERMRVDGVQPNEFTWNAMIAGYARGGDCDRAFGLFSKMEEEGLIPDLVSWNAMISGFVQSSRAFKAVDMFLRMLSSGMRPNQVTVTGLLPACGVIGSVNLGKEIHGFICRTELQVNAFVGSALVDMYSKCGCVKDAWNVFISISGKNTASWNAMIRCYGNQGMVDKAVELFEKMKDEERIEPNEVTFTSVLSSCSHGGLVGKGLEIFKMMRASYGIEPTREHYASVVDLLCRAGRMDEAYETVKDMAIDTTESIIGAFLNGCLIHERRDLAEKMVEEVVLKKPGGFVTLSNIYAGEGDWGHVEKIRSLMKGMGSLKMPGSSGLQGQKLNVL